MTKKSRSGSEKRKLEYTATTRVTPLLNHFIDEQAAALDITRGTVLRMALEFYFEYLMGEPVPETDQRAVRKRRAPGRVTFDARVLMQFIAALAPIGNNQNQHQKALNTARHRGEISGKLFEKSYVTNEKLGRALLSIQNILENGGAYADEFEDDE